MRTNIPQRAKIRAILQKANNSVCPICSNHDAEHFEFHHIDKNPNNHEISNLILICPTCHSKITKGDINDGIVLMAKKNPISSNIEFVNMTIDRSCSWTKESHSPLVFMDHVSKKSPFPLFNLSFINHNQKTIILDGIHLRAKFLPRGLSGIPSPMILEPSARYQLPIPTTTEGEKFELENQLQIPSEQAFKFRIELFEQYKNEKFQIEDRIALFFTFLFNNNISIKIPTVFLNCTSENESLELHTLS